VGGQISRNSAVLALIVALALGAFAAPTLAETVTIDYTVWGNASNEAAIIAAFEAAHPNIKVNAISGGGIDDYIDRLHVMSVSNTLPDVFGLNVQNAERFYQMNVALPLDPLVERDGVDLDACIPGCFAYARHNGVLYGFPRATRGAPYGAQVVAHNRDLLSQAGLAFPTNDWTFDDLREMAKKLTRRTGDGTATQWGMILPTINQWWAWVWSGGGEIMTDDNKGLRLTEDAAIDGLDFIRDLRFDQEVMPPPGVSANFSDGNVGFSHVSAFFTGPPDKNFDWSLTGFPRGPLSDAGYSRGGSNVVVISRNSDKQEAAWTFLKYLISEEAQRIEVFEEGNANPVLLSIALSSEYIERSEPPWDYRPVLEAKWKPAPMLPEFPEIDRVIQAGVRRIWNGNESTRLVIEEIMPQAVAPLAGR